MIKSNSTVNNSSFDAPHRSIDELFTKYNSGGLIVFEHPVDSYWEVNVRSIKSLLDCGCKGVYVSFQRPIKNIHSRFKQFGINPSDVQVLDITKIVDVKEISEKIYSYLKRSESDKKFVFIDSITTMELINARSWTDSFLNFLINIRDNDDFDNVIVLINTAKDLSDKKIVKGITSVADGVFSIYNSKSGYSIELVKPNILT